MASQDTANIHCMHMIFGLASMVVGLLFSQISANHQSEANIATCRFQKSKYVEFNYVRAVGKILYTIIRGSYRPLKLTTKP